MGINYGNYLINLISSCEYRLNRSNTISPSFSRKLGLLNFSDSCEHPPASVYNSGSLPDAPLREADN